MESDECLNDLEIRTLKHVKNQLHSSEDKQNLDTSEKEKQVSNLNKENEVNTSNLNIFQDDEDKTFNFESVLGTHDYWNNYYSQELKHYQENGTVDHDAMWFMRESRKIITWLKNSTISKDSSVIDIGCGNGSFLKKLYDIGFRNLHGFDYSSNAIDLAQKIGRDFMEDGVHKFTQQSILDNIFSPTSDCEPFLPSSFDLALDKGTFDTISLHPEDSNDTKKEKRKTYLSNIHKLLKEDGIFLITSCNYTEAELLNIFESGFVLFEKIPCQTFKFGGSEGSTVTSLVLRRKSEIKNAEGDVKYFFP